MLGKFLVAAQLTSQERVSSMSERVNLDLMKHQTQKIISCFISTVVGNAYIICNTQRNIKVMLALLHEFNIFEVVTQGCLFVCFVVVVVFFFAVTHIY
jgi:hypothetical protein